MTDRPTTNVDLQATLAVIEESLAKADIGAHLPAIEQQLGVMLDAAEAANNQSAIAAIADSWNRIQAMAQHGQVYKEAALTTVDLAKEIQQDFLQATKELETLNEDLENVNLDNPAIKRVHWTGMARVLDNSGCPGCDCQDNGHLPDIDHDAVNAVIFTILGYMSELSEKRTRQITRIVNTLGSLLASDLDLHNIEEYGDDEDGDDDDD